MLKIRGTERIRGDDPPLDWSLSYTLLQLNVVAII